MRPYSNFLNLEYKTAIMKTRSAIKSNKAFFVFCLLLLTIISFAQPGTLDNTFGRGGRIVPSFTTYKGNGANSAVIQPDQKILVYGSGRLIRYLSNGNIDPTFGMDATNKFDSGVYAEGGLNGVLLLQPDNKILVTTGETYPPYPLSSNFGIERFNADGTVDSAFGTAGIERIQIFGGAKTTDVTLQSDGKIVLIGSVMHQDSTGSYGPEEFALFRLQSNGKPDSSFGLNGSASVTSFGSYASQIGQYSVGLQNAGKIIVSASPGLMRFQEKGLLDSTFGIEGRLCRICDTICIEGLNLWMFKGHCFPKVVILQAVYFKLRFSLSYRDVEELLSIRGVAVDHATIQRWVYKFTPLIEVAFNKRRKAVGISWRMDETYIKVKGEWMYLYRAVDKEGKTVDFLLTKKRNKPAAHKFLIKAFPALISTCQ